MSRINQALTTWESTRGAVADAEPRAEVEATVGALNQYAEELLHRHEQPAPLPKTRTPEPRPEVRMPELRPEERTPELPSPETAAADSKRQPTASARAARDLEIEARLVT